MNSSPEFQPPREEDTSSIDTPIKPVTQASIESAPYDADITDFYNKDATVDTGQLQQVLENPDRLDGGRTPARELPKRKFGRNILIGFGATMAAVGVATSAFLMGVGKDDTDNNENLPTRPNTNNTAPVVPGVPVETVAPAPGETLAPIPNGAREVTASDIASYEKNVESTVLTFAEYKSEPEALPAIIDIANKIINYQPTDEELENSKDLVSPTGAVGPHAAAEKYRESFDGLFANKSDSFYQTLQSTGATNFDKWLQTKEAGDDPENLYTMTFSLDENQRLVIKDNVNKNSLPDDNVAVIYTLSPNMTVAKKSPSSTDPTEVYWKWDFGILTKYGETANE